MEHLELEDEEFEGLEKDQAITLIKMLKAELAAKDNLNNVFKTIISGSSMSPKKAPTETVSGDFTKSPKKTPVETVSGDFTKNSNKNSPTPSNMQSTPTTHKTRTPNQKTPVNNEKITSFFQKTPTPTQQKSTDRSKITSHFCKLSTSTSISNKSNDLGKHGNKSVSPSSNLISNKKTPTTTSSIKAEPVFSSSTEVTLNLTKPLKSKKDYVKASSSSNQQTSNRIKLEQVLSSSPSLNTTSNLTTPLKSKKNHVKRLKRRRYTGRKIICIDCKEKKSIHALDRCNHCYWRLKSRERSKKAKIIVNCSECNEMKQLYKSQMCSTCYRRKHPPKPKFRKRAECKNCKQWRAMYSLGLCGTCNLKSKPKQNCLACGDLETIYARNMCYECYVLNVIEGNCQKCGKLANLTRKMCKACYNKSRKEGKRLFRYNDQDQVPGPSGLTVTETSMQRLVSIVSTPKIECIDVSSDSD